MRILAASLGLSLILSLPLTNFAAPAQEALWGFHLGPKPTGTLPWSPLYLHTDGNFYGGGYDGGDAGNGALFRLTPSGQLDWLSFTGGSGGMPGKYPDSEFISTGDGWLWGTASAAGWQTGAGSPPTGGAVFRIRPDKLEYQVVAAFTGGQFTQTPGQNPRGRLADDGTGWLWGVTSAGGKGGGLIFKVNEVTGEFRVVYQFNIGPLDPKSPASLVFENNYLWGVGAGGTYQNGVLFRLDPFAGSPTPQILANFSGINTQAGSPRGGNLQGTLTPDGLGYLWGVASNGAAGYGAIFKVDTSTLEVTTVLEFSNNGATNKGALARGTLVAADDGMLWGVTNMGGTGNRGTVFQVNPQDGTLTTVVDFGAASAASTGLNAPINGLTNDGKGYLWGLAMSGAAQDKWAFYRVKIDDGGLTKIAEWLGEGPSPDGKAPKAAPVGAVGTDWLYGTTSAGGNFGFGTLYRYNAVTGERQTLVHFTGTTGAAIGFDPSAKLHIHTDGTVWGTTRIGNANNSGSVFKYDPANGRFTNVAGFSGSNPPNFGSQPTGKLVTGPDGKIWGVTSIGLHGSIFKIDPATGVMTIVKAFGPGANDAGGNQPTGGLVVDANGTIWGTTSRGGGLNLSPQPNIGNGTIFKINAATGVVTTVIRFTGDAGDNIGSAPTGDLALDDQGMIWGQTSARVFKLDPATGTLVTNVTVGAATGYPLELALGGSFYHHHDGLYYNVLNSGYDPERRFAGGGVLYRLKPGQPSVQTGAFSSNSGELYPGSVTLGGTVDLDGGSGSYSFEWGATTALGRTVTGNASAQTITANIQGLKGFAAYFFRLRVDAPAGTYYGPLQNFVTGGINEDLGISVHSPIATPLVHNSSSVDFGSVRVGASGQQTFTIQNVRQSALTLSGAVVSGPSAAEFAITTSPPASLLARSGGIVQSGGCLITYTPDGEGDDQATLTINSNDPGTPAFVVQLSGSGVVEPDIAVDLDPNIGLDTSGDEKIDFGSSAIGVGVEKNFTVYNTGNGELGSVAVEITGPDAADFEITGSLADTIAVDDSSSFGIVFTPSGGGERHAFLRITSDDPDEGEVEIELTGSSPASANIVVEEQGGGAVTSGVAIGFGTLPIGLRTTRTFLIRNSGSAPMTGISLSYTAGNQLAFFIGGSPPATLYPGEFAALAVTFAPNAPYQSASYAIASNAANNASFQLAMNGSGDNTPVPEISVEDGATVLVSNSSGVDFGTVASGSAGTKTLTIRSAGSGTLSSVAASFEAGSDAAFKITKAPAASVNSSQTTTMTVTYTPSANAQQNAVLLIASNDADENPFRIPLSGTGSGVPEPEIAVEENGANLNSGGLVFFTTIPANESATKTFKIRNTGAAPLTGISVSFGAGGSSAFTFVSPPVPATTLAKNAFTTFTVRFAPNAVGAFASGIVITSNDSDESPFTFGLGGGGQATLAPLFTAQPSDQLVLLNSNAHFEATATGTGNSYQWKKNGTAIKNATNSALDITAKTPDVGIYTLFAKNSAGENTSQPAYLGEVTLSQGAVNVKEGGTFTLNCTANVPKANGVTMMYSWRRSGNPLTDEAGHIAGANTKSLKLANCLLGDSGNYTCLVTMETPNGATSCANGDTVVDVVQKPTIQPFTLPDILVSESVNVPPVQADFASKFKATGLPPGVVLDAASGILSGKPTAAKIKAGAEVPYTVVFTATNAAGTSAPFSVEWLVQNFDTSIVGTFNGLVAREAGTNFNYGGTIQLTTTTKGTVSGSVVLAGQKYPVTGALDTSGGDNPSAVLTAKRNSILGNLMVKIDSLEIGNDRMTGTISDEQLPLITSELVVGTGEAGADDGPLGEATFDSPHGIVLVEDGGFIADTGNHTIRAVIDDEVSVFAGAAGQAGADDGTGTEARFNGPEGLAVDGANNLFVADTGNAAIRKITPAGDVTTLAVPAGTFSAPCALAFDDKGNLVVADRGNHTLVKIAPNGAATVLAGKRGMAGFKDGAGASALFNTPSGICFDAKFKAFFVCDTMNAVVRKVTPTGAVSTYAGSPGIQGDAPGILGNARFVAPVGIASDGQGNLVVADTLLVLITPGGIAVTVSDYVDDVGQADHPVALAFEPEDDGVFAADAGLHGITQHYGDDANSPQGAAFTALRFIYTNANTIPLNLVGNYTASLETSQAGDAAFPQGYGYATLALTKTGGATWAGKTADGSGITCGTFAGPEGEILLHCMAYKNTASIQGMTYIDGDGDWFSANGVDTPFDWFKLAQPTAVADRSYKSGFILHSLTLLGGKYTPPNNVFGFLDLDLGTTTDNAAAHFSGGGLAMDFDQSLNFKAPSALTVPANAAGVKLSIAAGTGVITGSFNEGTPARKASVFGVLVRNGASSLREGRGFFQLPQDTTAKGPMISGQLLIQKN